MDVSPWLFTENHLIPGVLFPMPFKHNRKLRTRPLEKGTSLAVGTRRAQSPHNAEAWSRWRRAFQAAHAWWPWWFRSRWSCGSQLKWGTHRGRGGPVEWTTDRQVKPNLWPLPHTYSGAAEDPLKMSFSPLNTEQLRVTSCSRAQLWEIVYLDFLGVFLWVLKNPA